VSEKNTDPWGMGHSSYQTLIGKRNSKVTIITGYQCIRNSSADASVWTQEKIFMQDQQSKLALTNPYKQFIKDLIEFINKRQSARNEIILNLDANEVLGEESQGINKLMRECDLLDLLDIPGLNNDLQLQDTYHRGNK
jgi:hypothetical protein